MNSVLSALVNGMVVSVGLAGVVWIALRLAPARSLNAATRYAIWWAVMAAVVFLPLVHIRFVSGPVAVTKPIGFVPSLSVVRPQTPTRSVGPIGFVPSSSRVFQPARPLFPVEIKAASWAKQLLFLWLGIAGLMLVRLVSSIVMLERRKARASEVTGLLERVCMFMCARRNVRVASSPEIPIPMAAGPWRPSILLPSQLGETLSERELEQVCIHEAGHFARYDDWALLVQRMIETVLVLNPVVWWVSRQIDLEREIACDDLVVAATGDAQPYAACLARVVELSGVVRGMPMAAAAAEDGSHLAKRVAMLLDRTRNHGTRLGGLRLGLAVICVAALAWGAVQNRGFVAFATAPMQTAAALHPQALMLAQTGVDGGIPQREREVIAGTSQQMEDKTATPQQAADAATRLAAAQAALHDEIRTRLLHVQAQEPRTDSEIENNLKAAADEMASAVESLRQQKWNDALANEQRVLQALLHADASDLRGTVRKFAAADEPKGKEIDFMTSQLEELARNLEQASSQIAKATPSELDKATEEAQFAENLARRLQHQLRMVALAQADSGGESSASVYVPLEIVDPMGRFVTGLGPEAFGVWEDGVQQHVNELLGTEAPPDIFLVSDWRYPEGADFSKVKGYVTPYQTPSGKVLDSLRTMSQLARTRRMGRKIAIVVAGSSENTSNYTDADLQAVLAGLAMPAFVFVVPESGASGQAGILNEIASRSGGRYTPVASAADVAAAINQVLPEVTNLYFVGYSPTNAVRDGSYRNVQVIVQAPRGLPPLTVHSASGYVAASQ